MATRVVRGDLALNIFAEVGYVPRGYWFSVFRVLGGGMFDPYFPLVWSTIALLGYVGGLRIHGCLIGLFISLLIPMNTNM